MVLLAFSLVFYAWGEPLYILLMVFSIVINYWFALTIDNTRVREGASKTQKQKRLLIAAIVANLALIGVFKYTDFAISSVSGIFSLNLPKFNIPLPIGISFYTFQIMSYVIDVYREDVPVQRDVLFLGAYLCGFPQLIAGPIVRYETIADELVNRKENLTDFYEGLRRFTAGLAKKVLIANNVAIVADRILGNAAGGIAAFDYEKSGAIGMWIAVICYALQIYYDFSGYSDMAIGMGKMMGFHYLENFNYPYIAKSVTDFWRRWHISLSTFFKDYVYIPLGGNRVSVPRWIFNTMVVWMLTGLWHGANWTFVLWGLYFGILLIVEKKLLVKFVEIPVVNHLYAITAFIFGWVIFRAESVGQIGTILKGMSGRYGAGSFYDLAAGGIIKIEYIIAAVTGLICVVPVSRFIMKKADRFTPLAFAADVASVAALLLCGVQLATGSYNPFIYFRF